MTPEEQEDLRYKIIARKAKWLGVSFIIGFIWTFIGVTFGIIFNLVDVLLFHIFVVFPWVLGFGFALDFWLPNYGPKDFIGTCRGETLDDPILLMNKRRQGFYSDERLKKVKKVFVISPMLIVVGFWSIVMGSLPSININHPTASSLLCIGGISVLCFGFSVLIPTDYLYPEVSPMRHHKH